MSSHSQKNKSRICWDAHACPPFKIGSDLSFLKRYKKAGVNFVSLNVGFDLTTRNEIIDLLHYFNKWIFHNKNEFGLASTVQEILNCRIENKLAIAFDIEGCNVLDGNLESVLTFYSLGVRQMSIAYNQNNAFGAGCFDKKSGLTNTGKILVKKFNEIGMIIDCSHVGYKTSLEIIDLSQHPVIFSHSNPYQLVNHPRNIMDEQIIACSKKNGVIGINGIGIYLGNNDTRTEKIAEHIDYIAQKVGIHYVGIGLDCVFDNTELNSYVKHNPDTFPIDLGFDKVATPIPEQFLELAEILSKKGYSENDLSHILGGNFFRIAETVWR